MKKQYNKPLCLDTCIFKNLLGYDDGKTNKNGVEFDEIYNKDKLKKYIKHHGYLMSDYNLYEVLRDEKWNSENVIKNLHRLNYKTKEKLSANNAKFKKFLHATPSVSRVNEFANHIFLRISDFAGDYYARILLFPMLFNLYTFLYLFNKRDIPYNKELISDKIESIIKIVSDKIKKEFMLYGKYTKSIFEKVINKFFLILNHFTIVFYNNEMLILSKKYESLNFENAQEDICYILNKFKQVILDFDYNEDIVRSDNSKNAKATDTIMYSIANHLMEMYKDRYNEECWSQDFKKMIDKVLVSIYGLREDSVMDIYFRNNIHDIYTKVLNDKNRGMQVKKI